MLEKLHFLFLKHKEENGKIKVHLSISLKIRKGVGSYETRCTK